MLAQWPWETASIDDLERLRLWSWGVFVFLAGACIGSFLGALAYRWPRGYSIFSPLFSFCPACRERLSWWANLPIIGYLLVRARCTRCRAPVSPRYMVIELVTAGLFLLVFWFFFAYADGPLHDLDSTIHLLGLLTRLVLLSLLVGIALIDGEFGFVPLMLSIPPIIFGPIAAAGLATHDLWLPMLTFAAARELGPAIAGATAGLLLANVLVWTGWLRRSYRIAPQTEARFAERDALLFELADRLGFDRVLTEEQYQHLLKELPAEFANMQEPVFNDRREMLWELAFLAFPLAGAVAAGLWWPAPNWMLLPEVRAGLGSLLGLLLGGLVVWYVRIIFTLMLGRAAMGMGDVHLLAGVGAVLGWFGAVLAFLLGPVVAVFALILRRSMQFTQPVPFGPWLCVGAVVAMLYGRTLWEGPRGVHDALQGLAYILGTSASWPLGIVGFGLITLSAGMLGLVRAVLSGPAEPANAEETASAPPETGPRSP